MSKAAGHKLGDYLEVIAERSELKRFEKEYSGRIGRCIHVGKSAEEGNPIYSLNFMPEDKDGFFYSHQIRKAQS